ncbi:MAG TPA: ATP synthase F1 subunit gamma [bacterium]|nr:ATP synthase F1 subunit gamma [bacterium]
MSRIREIKRRIKSVKSIGQVTHAMELVAASRMKRAQDNVKRGRAYSDKIREILIRITTKQRFDLHPLLDLSKAHPHKVLVLVFSTQRGLTGGLTWNMLKHTQQLLADLKKAGKEITIITIGKKISSQLVRLGFTVEADFSSIPEMPTTGDIRPIYTMIREKYSRTDIGEVIVVYPKFINAVQQLPVTRVILPLDFGELKQYGEQFDIQGERQTTFVFEPRRRDIIDQLLLSYLESQIYQAKLEAVASEYSARRMAMKNASDNAMEIQSALSLDFNKSRQAQITAELAEIAGGSL